MKNFLIAFGVFLAWSFFGLWIYSWLQPKTDSAKLETGIIENNLPDDLIIYTPPVIKIDSVSQQNSNNDAIVESPIPLEQGNNNDDDLKATNEAGDIIFIFSEGISIKKNNIEITISPSEIDFKGKIKTYLLEHPDEELHINSIYSPKESVLSPNIGIQRANEVYKLLIQSKIPTERLVTKSVIKDIIFNINDEFNNGIYFTFKPLNIKRVELLNKSIPEVRTVYPKFSESGILVNNDLKTLLNELVVYFDNNPAKKINIIGHTDNIGNGLDNYDIGLKYARQVRWYLITKGPINKNLINASSMGESEPIEDNNTHLGRIANRRIEIIFN